MFIFDSIMRTAHRHMAEGRATEALETVLAVEPPRRRQRLLDRLGRSAYRGADRDLAREAWSVLIGELSDAGAFEDAMATCDRCIERDRGCARWYMTRAELALRGGQVRAARAALNSAWQFSAPARRPGVARMIAKLPLGVL